MASEFCMAVWNYLRIRICGDFQVISDTKSVYKVEILTLEILQYILIN